MIILVTDCYLFFTCIFSLFFFSFVEHLISRQAMLIYVWVMIYQSLEINYHTAPNNKSTALPILQKLISIMVCLLHVLGRAEYWCYLIPIRGIEMIHSKQYSKSIPISGIWEKRNNDITKYGPANHKIPVYSNKMKKFNIWTLPWQALWQLPLHIFTAQAVAVARVWCSWWQVSNFQCRIALL